MLRLVSEGATPRSSSSAIATSSPMSPVRVAKPDQLTQPSPSAAQADLQPASPPLASQFVIIRCQRRRACPTKQHKYSPPVDTVEESAGTVDQPIWAGPPTHEPR